MRDAQGRFVKGTSGNHNGAGPGRPPIPKSLSDQLRIRGHQFYDEKTGETHYAKLAAVIWDLAIAHEDPHVRLKAAREILDRTEGRPAQRVEISADTSLLVKGYPQELLDKLK